MFSSNQKPHCINCRNEDGSPLPLSEIRITIKNETVGFLYVCDKCIDIVKSQPLAELCQSIGNKNTEKKKSIKRTGSKADIKKKGKQK